MTQTKVPPLGRDREPLTGTAEWINWSWNPVSKAQRETLILGWVVIKLPWQLSTCFYLCSLPLPLYCLPFPKLHFGCHPRLNDSVQDHLYSVYSPPGTVVSAKIKDEQDSPFPQRREACRLLGR